MFTVSEKNTVKCLEGFSRRPQSLLALSILTLLNFEPVSKRAVEACRLFFRPIPISILGSTGNNLESSARVPLVSVEGEKHHGDVLDVLQRCQSSSYLL